MSVFAESGEMHDIDMAVEARKMRLEEEAYQSQFEEIVVEHENGYSARLYGASSMSIYKDGKEIMHTGFRNEEIKTAEDVYELLEDYPEFIELLANIDLDDLDDEEDDV